MWIKRFHARNICAHKELEFELPRGLIGIFGPNGIGKSTVLDLAYACLSNDFGRFFGVKKDCIYDLADEDDESFIELDCDHHAQEFQIRRSLRPNGHSLIVRGEKKITDVRKIAERLDLLLGNDARSLELFVFKRQNQIDDIFTTTDAKRKEAFQALCGTEKCIDIHDLLGTTLDKDKDINTVVVDNSDEITQEIATLRSRRAEFEEAKRDAGENLLDDETLTQVRTTIRKRERYLDLRKDRTRVLQLIEDGETLVAKMERNYQLRFDKTETLSNAVKDGAAKATKAAVSLEKWSAYEKQQARYNKLIATREALLEETEDHAEVNYPEELPAEFDVDDTLQTIATMTNTLERATEIVEAFEDTEMLACPTCGTPTKKLATYLVVQREIVNGYPGEIAEQKHKLATYRKFEKEYKAYNDWKIDYNARRKANAAAIKEFTKDDAPSGNKDDFKAIVEAHDEAIKEYEGSTELLSERKSSWAAAKATHESNQKQLATLNTQIETNKVSRSKAELAETQLETHQGSVATIAKLDGQLEGVQEAIEEREEQLEELKIRLKRSKRTRKLVGILERAKEAMHRNNLPHRVASIKVKRLEGAINRDLELFGNPFWAEMCDDLTFNVHKPGHPVESAGRLSIGQRMILVIPFWFAWKSDIEMLCLDEPSANLDAANQAYLASALETLAASVRGSRQVIMVTHADGLRSSFDKVIEILPSV